MPHLRFQDRLAEEILPTQRHAYTPLTTTVGLARVGKVEDNLELAELLFAHFQIFFVLK